VAGSWPYLPAATVLGQLGRTLIVQKFTLFFELTEPNWRQHEDPFFNSMCTLARNAEAPTAEDLERLNVNYVDSAAEAISKVSQTSLWTATTWKVVDQLNIDDRKRLQSSGATTVNIFARYRFRFLV